MHKFSVAPGRPLGFHRRGVGLRLMASHVDHVALLERRSLFRLVHLDRAIRFGVFCTQTAIVR